jgi:pimeloyl-ACP methyl ester carboxylesterase/DNA-binding CsgD family transcriptional regulator
VEPDIRFCRVGGKRVAYATVGDGPLFVIGPRWVSHIEDDFEDPRFLAFVEELARTHRVVCFDRLGVGLSDRELGTTPTVELDARVLATVLDAFGDDPATIFAVSCAAPSASLYATVRPDRVHSLVYFGAFARRSDVPEAKARSLVEFVRSNWGLGAQVIASLLVPRASGDDIEALSRFQRHATSAEVAAAYLALEFATDVRDIVARVPVPALVLHRTDDRTVPIRLGRELASLLPHARFQPLAGDVHIPWIGGRRETLRAIRGFLQAGSPVASSGGSPLSSRETEVLRLVATGLNNREIATSLVLSEHTVHRHVANILRKLAQSSRAAAAAHAARDGLI